MGKNGNKKVKLNGLIHSKIVLVKDHVEYKKKQENPIIQILQDDQYRTFAMGHKKLFENMCQRTFFSKSRTSKLKETIKIRYYTLSIQKTYWKYQKRNKKTN
jgi:hypothetical protein